MCVCVCVCVCVCARALRIDFMDMILHFIIIFLIIILLTFTESTLYSKFGCWLNLLNAEEVSPKRYWLGLKSQEVEKE